MIRSNLWRGMRTAFITSALTYRHLAQTSWRRESQHPDARFWHAGAFIALTLLLFPYAVGVGWLLVVSYLTASFVALTYGYALRDPYVALPVYVGTLLAGEVTSLSFSTIGIALGGELAQAGIVLVVALYLMAHANALKRGEIGLNEKNDRQSAGQRRSRRYDK